VDLGTSKILAKGFGKRFGGKNAVKRNPAKGLFFVAKKATQEVETRWNNVSNELRRSESGRATRKGKHHTTAKLLVQLTKKKKELTL